MIEHMLAHPRCNVYAPMGVGKSSAALVAMDALLTAGLSRRVLVIAPLRVARTVWPEEAARWTCFSHLTLSAVVGTRIEREVALETPADIHVVNYENVPWLVEHLGDSWPFDTVVADESIRWKGLRLRQGTKRAGSMRALAHTKVRRWINLSGMAVENGLTDLWAQLWFIDQGQRLGRTFDAFESRWFAYKRKADAFSHKAVQMLVLPHAQGEIQDLIRDVTLTIDLKDWFKLDEPIVNTIPVDLPPDARRAYKSMEREFYARIQGHEIEAFNAGAKSQKLSQFASGAAYQNPLDNDRGEESAGVRPWVRIHDEKLDALESVVNEAAGMPILVAYHFRSDLVRLKARFPKGREVKTETEEADFKAGIIPIGFVHPQSIGHGVDGFQRVTNILVFFSFNWAAGPYTQLIERIGPMRQMQAGMNRPVFVHHIVARDTIDEDVIERLTSKREVFETLVDGIKRRNETEEEANVR